MNAEPGRYDAREWRGRPGSVGAAQIRRRKRNPNTSRSYDEKLRLWWRFNNEGDGHHSYDPLVMSVDKFDLFAGRLLGDAEHGVKGESGNKDLNVFRSALNREFEENGLGRPLRNEVEVENTIKHYRALQILSKGLRGEDSDLQRVPYPESAFVELLQKGATLPLGSEELHWVGVLLLQLLGWLRGNSVGGFQAGDVRFDVHGYLHMAVRRMKMRPDFTVHPGLITVPPAPAGDAQHARARVFAVLRRCFASDQYFCMVVARSTDPAVFVQTGEDKSAAVLTKQLRVLCRRLVESLPAGVIVASHSWREMAATACFLAKYDSIRMASHGFWQNVGTMYDSYIKPYKNIFPNSRLLAQLFDFLRAV